jgi:hypothetical protein
MNKILRIVITAFAGMAVSMTIFIVFMAISLTINPGRGPAFSETGDILPVLWVSFLSSFPQFVIGGVVAGFRFRPVYAAAAGFVGGILACVLSIAISTVIDYRFLTMVNMRGLLLGTAILCFVCTGAGWACGFLSPRNVHEEDVFSGPPPPDAFDLKA